MTLPDKPTRIAQAKLIAEKHPDVDCIIEAYQHLHAKRWGDVPAPDVSVPPHERD